MFFLPIIIFVFIAFAVVKSAKKMDEQNKRAQSNYSQKEQRQPKPAVKSQRSNEPIKPSITLPHDNHQHFGKEEDYEPIEGSLGDVNDEGCPELDGIRLISEDLAYVNDGNEMEVDYAKLVKVMVLGETLNQPRFKQPYLHNKKR